MFIEIPASKTSISMRKLIHGVGVNDANYIVTAIIGGNNHICPYYKKWKSMIVRCYSLKYKKIRPTYSECTVCDEWHIFSTFKSWMKAQDWEGKDLDKDILFQGNKIYSPSTCFFVTKEINNLINSNSKNRGAYPVGVSLYGPSGKFMSRCRVNGKDKTIGYFGTAKDAHVAYKEFKYSLIRHIAKSQEEPIKSALLDYIIKEY